MNKTTKKRELKDDEASEHLHRPAPTYSPERARRVWVPSLSQPSPLLIIKADLKDSSPFIYPST